MTKALGIQRCRGIRPSGSYCTSYDHHIGDVDKNGVVHWADREFRWPSAVRFLKLVAMSRDPTINEDQPWRRIYRLNVALRGLEKEVHLRVPTRYQSTDRAFVRASVAPLPNSEPLRKEAFDWSRRQGGHVI